MAFTKIAMDIFSLFTLCGGLAFFLYGMTTMSKSLEKMAGGKESGIEGDSCYHKGADRAGNCGNIPH